MKNPAAPVVVASPAALPVPGPVALCLLRGPTYVVELFNSMAARVWGQPASRVLGQPFLQMLPQAEVARYTAACAAVWRSGQAVGWSELPVAIAGPGGPLVIRYFTLSFEPFPFPGEEVAGILLVAQEVTSLLQARHEVQQLQAELAATIAGLADYVAELIQGVAGNG